MNGMVRSDAADDLPAVDPTATPSGKPMSPQPHLEVSGQREDAGRHGDDEFDSGTNIIAGDRVPKHTPEAERARVARERGRPPLVPGAKYR